MKLDDIWMKDIKKFKILAMSGYIFDVCWLHLRMVGMKKVIDPITVLVENSGQKILSTGG